MSSSWHARSACFRATVSAKGGFVLKGDQGIIWEVGRILSIARKGRNLFCGTEVAGDVQARERKGG